jgi:transcriptional regulator with XRE-family HTH domain
MRVASSPGHASYVSMEWRQKLRNLRELRRLSQEDLGALIGVAQTRITKWENGTGAPDPGQLLKLSRALGVSLDYLADDSLDEETTRSPGLSRDELELLARIRDLGIVKATLRLAPEIEILDRSGRRIDQPAR